MTRQTQGLFVGCLFVSIALFVIVYIDYMRQLAKNNFVEWDVKTVTAGDYTIEFDIEERFYRVFKENHGASKPADMTMVQHFKKWITAEMESKLKQMPDLGFEDEPQEEVKIALATFAFDNAELILLLRERGLYIN